jgi:PAS domain S-box-containing protein
MQVNKTAHNLPELEFGSLIGAMDAASQGISIADASHPDRALVYVNDAFIKLTGYDRSEIIGNNCRFLQGKNTDKKSVDTIRNALNSGDSCTVEIVNYKKNGEQFLNKLIISPIRDSLGKITHYAGIQTDITDLKKIENSLSREDSCFFWSGNLLSLSEHNSTSEKLQMEVAYVQLLKNVAISANESHNFKDAAIETISNICKYLNWDYGYCYIIKNGKIDICLDGQPLKKTSIFHENYPNGFRIKQVLSEKKPHWLCGKNLRDLGIDYVKGYFILPIEVSGEIVAVLEFLAQGDNSDLQNCDNDRLGEILNIISVQLGKVGEREEINIEMLNLERMLMQAQKMESLGTFTSGISHDFNNLLTPIQSLSQLNMRRAEEGSSLYKDMETIYNASKRGKELIKKLLSFGHETELEFVEVDVCNLLDETINLLSSIVPSSININKQTRSDNNLVMANPTQLQQVIMNMVSNSVAAIGQTTGSIDFIIDSDDKYSIIHIKDTGSGIPENIMHRIYDPFFTTKNVHEGTGLGLSVAYGIIKKHKGMIDLDSKLGKGTTFKIKLPLKKISL